MEVRDSMNKKGLIKTMGLIKILEVILERTISVKVVAGAMAGELTEKEESPPGRIIMIVRDRAPKKETTRREVVVVEDKIIKIEAGDMTNSHNIAADTVPHNRNNISICHRPQPHPKAFSQHLHHMIQTGN